MRNIGVVAAQRAFRHLHLRNSRIGKVQLCALALGVYHSGKSAVHVEGAVDGKHAARRKFRRSQFFRGGVALTAHCRLRQPVVHGKAAACVHVQGGVLRYREDCARHHLVGVVYVVHAVGQNHFKGVRKRQHHFFRAEALQAEHARSCAAAYGDGAYARVGIYVGRGGATRNVPCAVVRFGEIRALFEHYQPRPEGEVGVAVVAHHQHVLRSDCAPEVQACHAYFPCAVVNG